MRTIVSLLSVIAVGTSIAMAQTQPAPKATTGSPPVTATPVPGANSFTQGEAKSRIEKAGYTNVDGLTKDDQGIWRGTASKDGKSVKISLDYKGNISEN
jgi:putative membrane protein